MKKVIVLSAFALCFFLSSFAKIVDEATAIKVARNFYSTKATVNSNIDLQNLTVSLGYKYSFSSQNSTDGANLFYVFNINSNDGFVIVSGDDIVTPVVGYSDKGTYTGTNLPPAFKK